MENSAPSLKIFRTKFSTSDLYNPNNYGVNKVFLLLIMVEVKIGGKIRFENFTIIIIPFAPVGYEVIITNSRYALVSYFITLSNSGSWNNCFVFGNFYLPV